MLFNLTSAEICYLRAHRGQQVAPSSQTVSRGSGGKDPAYPGHPAVAGFPEIANDLEPAEYFLQPLPQPLADGLAGVPGGTAVNGRPTAMTVLRHLRHYFQGSQGSDKNAAVITFVRTHGNAVATGESADQVDGRLALSRARGRRQAGRHHKAMTVCHQDLAHKKSLASLPWPLRQSLASGAVVEAGVWLPRSSP